MKISNAFQRKTRNGKNVFRINLDNNEILSYLENGKTTIAIDIITNQGGLTKIISGTSKKNGKPYKALMYYTWAMEPRKEEAKQ